MKDTHTPPISLKSADPEAAKRLMLPISSMTVLAEDDAMIPTVHVKRPGQDRVTPCKKTTLKMRPSAPFIPDRLSLHTGDTYGGAADWIINDIRCDDLSQFKQSVPIPGDIFATSLIEQFVQFSECRRLVEIDITYVGQNPEGCVFDATVFGSTL